MRKKDSTKRYMCYLEDTTQLMEKLDEKFLSFADEYKVNKWHIPAMIESEVLMRCGYFDSMPHQLTATCFIDKEAFGDKGTDKKDYSNSLRHDGYYLTPAACVHFYPMLEENNLRNELITTKARVYRHEDGNYESGKRLWDFTVREFVAVGTSEYVHNFLEDFKVKTEQVAKEFDSNIEIRLSNDHFYPSKCNMMKERIQKNNKMKYELVVSIDGKELALASFNFHGFHFSKSFNFDEEGEIVSGCVGFGLERWISFVEGSEKNGI